MADGQRAGDYRLRLPKGVVLDGVYRIDDEIGAGGFGITYRGRDLKLGHAVAIKEYFPNQIGNRDSSMSVHPITAGQGDIFVWGREGFIREAQMLASFRHPNIVRVLRYFEANNTAYMVLEYEEGPSFAKWLDTLGRHPTQDELDRITLGLMTALEEIHKKRLVHRDIAPDNIIIRSDLAPVVLDFGAARYEVHETTAGQTQSFAIIKAYYSPLEQRSTEPKNRGPWSDIYSLGATLYRAVAGVAPRDVQDRVVQDEPLQTAVAAAAGKGYRPSFLEGIDAAMSIKRPDRPQTIAAMRAAMGFDKPATEPPPPPPPPSFWQRYAKQLAGAAAAIVLLGVWMLAAGPKPPGKTQPQPGPAKKSDTAAIEKPPRDRTDWNNSRNTSRASLDNLAGQTAAVERALDARQWDLALERIEGATAHLKSISLAVDTLARSAMGDEEKGAAAELQSGAIAFRQRLDRLKERAGAARVAAANEAAIQQQKALDDEVQRRKAAEEAQRQKALDDAARIRKELADAAARANDGAARARDQIETEDNASVEGPDLNILRNTSRAVCFDNCQKNAQCRSFAYDKWNEWCFLKTEARTLRFDPKYESGFKRSERPIRSTEPLQFDTYRRRTFPAGASETTQRTQDAEQCETACDGNRACIAYTFLHASRTCRLIRATPSAYVPDEDATSGVKRQAASANGANAASAGVATQQSQQAPAPGTYTVWLHNDSEMRLIADGVNRRFVYEKPREGLVSRGVRRGTLLFDGKKDGDAYSGRSRIFSQKCGAIEYDVSGTVAADQRRVEMTGKRPIIDDSCRVIRTEPDVLVFEFLETRTE